MDVSQPLSEVSSPNSDVQNQPTLRCGGQDVPSANALSRGNEAAVGSSVVSNVDAYWLDDVSM